MKILSSQRFFSLLEKERVLDSIKRTFPDNKNYLDYITSLKIIDTILEQSESLFNISLKAYNENEFYDKLNKFSKYLGEALKYDFIVFGYKQGSKLIDLVPYYEGKAVKNKKTQDFKEVQFRKSFVGQLISKTNEPFIWQKKVDGDILNYEVFKASSKNYEIDEPTHFRLKDYFSFLEIGVKELVICPVSINSTDSHTPLGYLILANKKEDINEEIEPKVLKTLGYYLSQIFKNQSTIFQLDKDARFVSEIYEMYFQEGITKILEFCVEEFSMKYSSFWVPTKEEKEVAFGLKECISNELSQDELSTCFEQDFYLSSGTILGKINNKEITPFYENLYIVEKPSHENTGFRFVGEIIESDFLIVCPVEKYSNSKFEHEHGKKDTVLGYFCFYTSNQINLEDLSDERIQNFIDRISFYIEHILYDHTFHTLEVISKVLFKIDDITDVSEYYSNLVTTVNSVMNSEHTSIFFPNEDGELYLKSSTSKDFWKVDKSGKDILKNLDKSEYENNPLSPIYKDMNSITFRCYNSKETIIVHDVHDEKTVADCSFYEATKTFHKSIIFSPIVENGKCVGVIRCINKKEFDDSFLKLFTVHDSDTLSLICSFIGSQHQKIQSFDQQQLFIEKLAHENKTPVSLIWSAIENLEDKLSKVDFYDDKSLNGHFENIMFATSVINNNYGNLNAFLKHKERRLSYHFEYVKLKDKIEEISVLIKPLLQKEENKFVIFKHNIYKMPIVKVDETRMYQVIYNIIHNAVRYCESSSTINIFYKPDKTITIKDKTVECFEVRFENYGIGIPQEDSEKIFDPYFRSENARRISPNGTGIGLYVARTIAEGHGGTVRVTKNSKPTTLSVFLPNSLIKGYEENTTI